MTHSIDTLRRRAKKLHKAYEAGHTAALQRVQACNPRNSGELVHADFLYVIAREEGFASWPRLKIAAETQGLDVAQKLQRLKLALFHGHHAVVQRLLDDTPELAEGHFELQVALLNRSAVLHALSAQPELATTPFGPRRPVLHLAFSRYIHHRPELADDMLAIAKTLVDCGADVNDSYQAIPGSSSPLSALYGAMGHADNMILARWLLEQGADPNDGESLYHSTELGHHDGLTLLLKHGAKSSGTNALLRAMDFHDVEAVKMLLEAGADVNEFNDQCVGGESPWVIPALHQAARRFSDSRMIALLFEHGVDTSLRYQGLSAYGFARVFGNTALAKAIVSAGAEPHLSPDETLLAAAADGEQSPGRYIDPATLAEPYRNIIRSLVHLPDKIPHIQRLVALGVEYDRPDAEGLTPIHVAGWEGLPDTLDYLLSLKPDLTHVNQYGGTLLSTIIHGSENCPNRHERDYIACAERVLKEGVALPTGLVRSTSNENLAAFLEQWGSAHPGQVVQGG